MGLSDIPINTNSQYINEYLSTRTLSIANKGYSVDIGMRVWNVSVLPVVFRTHKSGMRHVTIKYLRHIMLSGNLRLCLSTVLIATISPNSVK